MSSPTDPHPQHAGYPYPQPGQPSPGPAYPAEPKGTVSWAVGFISLTIPAAGLAIAAIVMVCVYPASTRRGIPVQTQNARNAANWGLTVLSLIVLFALYVVVLAVGFPSTHQGFFPIGIAVIALALLSLVHFIVTIAGTVVSSKGRVFRPLAIPYLRERKG